MLHTDSIEGIVRWSLIPQTPSHDLLATLASMFDGEIMQAPPTRSDSKVNKFDDSVK